MEIKVIEFGNSNLPNRKYNNDAGADVYSTLDKTIFAGTTTKIPLGIGLELPDGYVAFVCPRSGLASKGITCELAPIDSGYRGEIHAIVTNNSTYTYSVKKNDRIGQLVILPVVIANFTTQESESRGANGFGSSGK